MSVCYHSPSKEHEYKPSQYSRDDQGFYLKCVHCGHIEMFSVDTEEDLYSVFGIDYNDDWFDIDDDDY